MSEVDEVSEYDARFAIALANQRERVSQARARLRRFAEWRATRRATKAERRARQEEWTAQIPPWAFGILHR